MKSVSSVASQSVHSPPASLKPYLSLDAWRGIASLAVVMFHWSELAVLHQPALAVNFLYASCLYGFLGVQIFFVVSGYCIANAAVSNLRKSEGIAAFVRARTWRIYPAYWSALLLACAFTGGGRLLADRGIIRHNVFTQTNLLAMPPAFYFSNVTLTMLPLHQDSLLVVAWTLCYELAFYGIVGLALYVANKTRRHFLLLDTLNFFTIFLLLLLIVFPQRLVFPFDLWPQFGLGIMVYDLLSRPANRNTKISSVVIALLFTIFIVLHNSPLGAMGVKSRLPSLIALLFAAALLGLYRVDTRLAQISATRVLGWVGVFSYSLYLTHAMTVRVVNQMSGIVRFPAPLHYLLFLISLLLSVAVAFIFYLCCEKPLLRKKGRSILAPIQPGGIGSPDAQAHSVGVV